jgi:signal peptidase I
MKKFFSFIWEVAKIVTIALLIVVPIRYFLFQPFFVRGDSMKPNFENNDYLIVDEISYRFREPLRGEVIVFKYPNNPSQRYLKRIIGLPGEEVEIKDGKVMISPASVSREKFVLDESAYLPEFLKTQGDMDVFLGENEYFVLGDNRTFSSDSRRWGTLPEEDIIGKVFLRPWPFTAMAKIEAPSY